VIKSQAKAVCRFQGVSHGTCGEWLARETQKLNQWPSSEIEMGEIVMDCEGPDGCNGPEEIGCPSAIVYNPVVVVEDENKTLALPVTSEGVKDEGLSSTEIGIICGAVAVALCVAYGVKKAMEEPLTDKPGYVSDKAKKCLDQWIEPEKDAEVGDVTYGVIKPKPSELRLLEATQRPRPDNRPVGVKRIAAQEAAEAAALEDERAALEGRPSKDRIVFEEQEVKEKVVQALPLWPVAFEDPSDRQILFNESAQLCQIHHSNVDKFEAQQLRDQQDPEASKMTQMANAQTPVALPGAVPIENAPPWHQRISPFARHDSRGIRHEVSYQDASDGERLNSSGISGAVPIENTQAWHQRTSPFYEEMLAPENATYAQTQKLPVSMRQPPAAARNKRKGIKAVPEMNSMTLEQLDSGYRAQIPIMNEPVHRPSTMLGHVEGNTTFQQLRDIGEAGVFDKPSVPALADKQFSPDLEELERKHHPALADKPSAPDLANAPPNGTFLTDVPPDSAIVRAS